MGRRRNARAAAGSFYQRASRDWWYRPSRGVVQDCGTYDARFDGASFGIMVGEQPATAGCLSGPSGAGEWSHGCSEAQRAEPVAESAPIRSLAPGGAMEVCDEQVCDLSKRRSPKNVSRLRRPFGAVRFPRAVDQGFRSRAPPGRKPRAKWKARSPQLVCRLGRRMCRSPGRHPPSSVRERSQITILCESRLIA